MATWVLALATWPSPPLVVQTHECWVSWRQWSALQNFGYAAARRARLRMLAFIFSLMPFV